MEIITTQESIDFLDDKCIQTSFKASDRIKVGEPLKFDAGCRLESFVGFHGSRTFCDIGYQSYTSSRMPDDVKIGRYSSLSWGIDFPSFNHPHACLSTSPFTHDIYKQEPSRAIARFKNSDRPNFLASNPQKQPVVIEHDVWVGQNSTIMSGVVLKTGSIVAAHSVVTKTFPPYSIIGGNPARLIRMRFPDEIISELLLSEWWRYNFVDFNHLDFQNIRSFLVDFAKLKNSLSIFTPKIIFMKDVPGEPAS